MTRAFQIQQRKRKTVEVTLSGLGTPTRSIAPGFTFDPSAASSSPGGFAVPPRPICFVALARPDLGELAR